MCDEEEIIDLSAFTYPEFLTFFFERPVLEDSAAYNLFQPGGRRFDVANPVRVIEHLTEMCAHFASITTAYSDEQIEQGLWAVFGGTIDCGQYLFTPTVSIETRVRCIESMYCVFRDVVVHQAGGERDTFYWMWWDLILHTDALRKGPEGYRSGYATLTSDEEQIIDAIFATLCRILDLDHKGCQWAAIHGMGHLYHPSMQVRTQAYLDKYRAQLSEDDVLWIERARQNRII